MMEWFDPAYTTAFWAMVFPAVPPISGVYFRPPSLTLMVSIWHKADCVPVLTSASAATS
jgi:hypothetical protein